MVELSSTHFNVEPKYLSYELNEKIILTEDQRAAFTYARCLYNEQVNPDRDNVQSTLGEINPGYNGILSKEIKEFADKYMNSQEWNYRYKTYLQATNQLPQDKEPSIGMTTDEVNNSTWGKPESKNKTTNASGTSEQWVYSNYRYIYLDNGIVTSIQDH